MFSSNPYVFAYGNRRKITHRWYQRFWKQACEEAEVADLRFYEMKHTLGTRLAANGCSAFTIQHVMNHAQIASTNRYVKNQKEATVEALRGVEKALNGMA